jgi:hypothetical protein
VVNISEERFRYFGSKQRKLALLVHTRRALKQINIDDNSDERNFNNFQTLSSTQIENADKLNYSNSTFAYTSYTTRNDNNLIKVPLMMPIKQPPRVQLALWNANSINNRTGSVCDLIIYFICRTHADCRLQTADCRLQTRKKIKKYKKNL